jgi:hypothetical protein
MMEHVAIGGGGSSNELWESFLYDIFPVGLDENEGIFLNYTKAIPEGQDKRGRRKYEEVVCKSIFEIKVALEKYGNDNHIYHCLSTCMGVKKGKKTVRFRGYKNRLVERYEDIINYDRKTESMYKRHVIGLDFDKKDFDKSMMLEDFIRHFESSTGLEYHYIVDSGNGYHFYILIKETKEIGRVVDITKKISMLTGADLKVAIPTATLRLPGSLNLKKVENPLPVRIVAQQDTTNGRYKLEAIETIIRPKIVERGFEKKTYTKEINTGINWNNVDRRFICIKNMLERGVEKGERNDCQGRIMKYFKEVTKLDYDTALEKVLLWNDKCSELCKGEEKSEGEVAQDFYRYWNRPQDRLLGCISEANPISHILAKFCDEKECRKKPKTMQKPKECDVDDEVGDEAEVVKQFFWLDKRYVTDECLKLFDGYCYLLIKVLRENAGKYKKVAELTEMVGGNEKIVRKSLKKLLEMCFVEEDTSRSLQYRIIYLGRRDKDTIDLRVPVKIFDLLKERKIKQTELMIWIAMRRNSVDDQSCTYEHIGGLLGISKQQVYRLVKKKMQPEGTLKIVGTGVVEKHPGVPWVIKTKGNRNKVMKFNVYGFAYEELNVDTIRAIKKRQHEKGERRKRTQDIKYLLRREEERKEQLESDYRMGKTDENRMKIIKAYIETNDMPDEEVLNYFYLYPRTLAMTKGYLQAREEMRMKKVKDTDEMIKKIMYKLEGWDEEPKGLLETLQESECSDDKTADAVNCEIEEGDELVWEHLKESVWRQVRGITEEYAKVRSHGYLKRDDMTWEEYFYDRLSKLGFEEYHIYFVQRELYELARQDLGIKADENAILEHAEKIWYEDAWEERYSDTLKDVEELDFNQGYDGFDDDENPNNVQYEIEKILGYHGSDEDTDTQGCNEDETDIQRDYNTKYKWELERDGEVLPF